LENAGGKTTRFSHHPGPEAYLKHVRDERAGLQQMKEAYAACFKKASSSRQEQECASLICKASSNFSGVGCLHGCGNS
jgi:hypothetical protein